MEVHTVLTIGHSNLSIDDFVGRLRANEVTMVIDVRSAPYSRYVPQFNRESIARTLESFRTQYDYCGGALGGRPKSATHYLKGRVDYQSLARSPDFQVALERVIGLAGSECLVLMCSEGDPLQCHRFLLLSRCLKQFGLGVSHILPDGKVEVQTETESRLLSETGLLQGDLWESNDVLARAYSRQTERVAYSEEHL